MRIIRGELGGRLINPPKNLDARPTTDFAKEGLFNVLENRYDFESLKVLDLFAGTGSISFEFASRGCKNVTAVDLLRKHTEFIEKTAKMFYPENNPVKVIQADVLKFINNRSLAYDIIFADPPYDFPELQKIPELILKNEGLPNEFLLIFEHSPKFSFTHIKNFVEKRNYGKVNFSMFEKK